MEKLLTSDAAKLLEAAYRELNMTEEEAEAIMEIADGNAQMDGSRRIEARHMVHALAHAKR